MTRPSSGGGWQAIRYTMRQAGKVGYLRLYRAMKSRNACKTCALGMGGQLGGMRNEHGHFPEFCKKSLQAMAADMNGKVEPRLFETYSLRDMRSMSPRELEALGRLVDPVYAGPDDDRYRTVSWDDALEIASGALRNASPERSFFYASGRSSNEAGFLLQLFARAFGTNHVTNCSDYCHQASGVGLAESIGSGTATVNLDDLERCDAVFLIGGNPASNHPRLMASLVRLRARGGRVVVVNPLREVGLERFRVPSNVKSLLLGSEVASIYLQPKIGGDIALLAGVAKSLIESGDVDRDFIEASTSGFEELRAMCEALDWQTVEAASGLSQEQIEEMAWACSQAERAIFAWTMGITHHAHGVQNVQWIANLALLRGMVGKPGAGLLPIRGHSNVQGMGTVGVTPVVRKAALEGLERLGIRPPGFQGYDTLGAIEAASRGEMDFVLCLGGNLYGASPDAAFASEALGNMGTVCYLSTTLNTGHVYGLGRHTLILPVRARDEESQGTTQESMFSYVRLSDGGPARYEGPRSEVDVITDLAHRVLGDAPVAWSGLKDHDAIRRLIAELVPNLAQVEEIGETKREFAIPGRRISEPVFPTKTGKAHFKAHPLPDLPELDERELRLMTIRSEGQFNTVVYEDEDVYRGQERRDVILMNADDISRLGLEENELVTVRSASGETRSLVRPIDIAQGCAAMYYPEANVLVPRERDPRSKTPAFKSVVVAVAPVDVELSIPLHLAERASPVEGKPYAS
ncbi:MAG TPA: FdhF/YdeP family oxidoreductase [Fimbriimonas sp.]